MANRRSSYRIPLVGFVDIKMVEKKITCSGFIEQISLSGIGIYTRHKIPPGCQVVLELLCFIGNDRFNITIPGIVKNCGGLVSPAKKDNELGVVAIKFNNEINPFDHKLLKTCLIELESKQKQRRKGMLRLV